MLSANCTVDVLSPDALGSLAREWGSLWRSVEGASPFLSPGWLLAWAEAYAPSKVHVATLRSGGELAAVLPVFAWDGALLLAGTGPSDHGGLLARRGFECRAGELLETASRIDLPFQRIDLQQLSPESPLAEAQVPGWQAANSSGDGCVVLELAGKDGTAHTSKKIRGNWRYAVRRIEREGGAIELVQPDETGEAVAALERLHAMRWKERGESGVLADCMMQGLLRKAADCLSEIGLLRLYRLRLDGRTIAVLFAMRGGNRACYFISGFDPAHAQLSPGTALVGHAISQAAAEGATEFDFLRGAEDYKFRWGAEEQPRIRRIFTRPG